METGQAPARLALSPTAPRTAAGPVATAAYTALWAEIQARIDEAPTGS